MGITKPLQCEVSYKVLFKKALTSCFHSDRNHKGVYCANAVSAPFCAAPMSSAPETSTISLQCHAQVLTPISM